MRRYGVRIERVQHDQVELVFRRTGEFEATIAGYNVTLASAPAHERKETRCYYLELWIDLEEPYTAMGACICRYGAGTQSNHGDMLVGTVAHHFHDVRQRTFRMVVEQRLPNA